MEASALPAPVPLPRFAAPLLKLRSDEQLVALFRSGSEEAFTVIHDRYKQRLFAYCRQMLNGPRQDAEDVLQDVFVRAYSALRNDEREVNLRAWLYRVAHNRCIDQLRRPAPAEREIFEMSRTPLHDPIVEAQRREDLRKLVADVGNLPEQQRSALLMREIDGMSYADLADALGVTVPAVKSLLVRARIGLAEAAEARDMDCSTIREDLALACDKGVRMSGRARKHLRECAGCRDYKVALRGTRTSFAALTPGAGLGLAVLAKLGVGGGATGGGAAAAGGGIALGTVSAGKVAAVVAAAALATGGAVEVQHVAFEQAPTGRVAGGELSTRSAGLTNGRAARPLPQAPLASAADVAAVAAVATAVIEREPVAAVPAKRAPGTTDLRRQDAAASPADRTDADRDSATVGSAQAPVAVDPDTPVTQDGSASVPALPGDGTAGSGTASPSSPGSGSSSAGSGGSQQPSSGSGSVRGGTAAGSSGSGPSSGSGSTNGGTTGAGPPPGEAPPSSSPSAGASSAPPGSTPQG